MSTTGQECLQGPSGARHAPRPGRGPAFMVAAWVLPAATALGAVPRLINCGLAYVLAVLAFSGYRASGSDYERIHSFGDTNKLGIQSYAEVIEGKNADGTADGWLYGTTERGGSTGFGMVFKMRKSEDVIWVLKEFTGTDGGWPSSRLVQGRNGEEDWLYGTTAGGGPVTSYGTVFKLNISAPLPATTYQVLTNFTGGPTNGAFPRVGLALGSDGYLFGTTTGGGTADQGTVFKVNKTGTDCQLVWSFKTEGGDGANARAPLVADGDGWLYGTTEGGGEYRMGTVFRMRTDNRAGNYEVLHSFNGPDGQIPRGGLLLASDGKLYGITTTDSIRSSGTVFSIGKDGRDFDVIWRFREKDFYDDGFGPYGALVEDCDGWLYGTTSYGGASRPGYPVYGTVFKMRKDGSGYRVIKQFSCTNGADPDGVSPRVGLVIDQDWLYGTTYGQGLCGYQYGTVFKLNRHGTDYGYEVLWGFREKDTKDGYHASELILDHTGEWLYGTTVGGGSFDYGTMFRLQKDAPHAYQVLWSFSMNSGDGYLPEAGLVEGADGTFYGTTRGGGSWGPGTVFKLRAVEDAFDYAVLYSFWGDGDATGAASPYAGLVRGINCNLYGTTALGGDMGWGTVYRFDPSPGDHPPLAVADTFVTQARGSVPAIDNESLSHPGRLARHRKQSDGSKLRC